ncbi:FixH family protein [Rehaibacterium terrae]|jgi:hypothetical protein|uniref:Nitrogen fixation protein FixH n=1 Tax=Rehaibacterium terrae TaxID=1341696 RepID=A0A7W8DDI5_9GAMM|nr:FixH family protein [Rehaibacterium terrae]MBB5015151.1 hypothetical protein [Rehaibacterium terrae]
MNATVSRPWYREPMVWLMLAFPLSAVIAGLSTVAIAVRAGGADAVPESVRRTAQVQIADLAADQRALELGLSARLDLDADTGAVRVTLEGDAGIPARLHLSAVHPTAAAADEALPLLRQDDAFLGRFTADRSHDWKLVLTPESGDWRLIARLPAGATRARLHPALTD